MDDIQLSTLETSLEPVTETCPQTSLEAFSNASSEIAHVTPEVTTNPSLSSIYQTLPARHIRVLSILPVEEADSDLDSSIVRAELQIIDLEKNPKFTAISYVWGAFSEPNDFITCGGVNVSVSINCLSALRHLRTKLGHFTIWVDAVCINQKDDREKEQQLPLMGDIYTLADAVYIWLGDSNLRTDRAMFYMARTHFGLRYNDTTGNLICRPYYAAWEVFKAKFSWTNHPIPFKRSKNQRGQFTTFRDLEELLERVWIKRLWTYQEILLASNPIVVCGTAHVPWFTFERSIVMLDRAIFFDTKGLTGSWSSVAFSRERIQASRNDTPLLESSSLQVYSDSVKKISDVWMRVHKIILVFLAACVVGDGLYAKYGHINTWKEYSPVVVILCCIAILAGLWLITVRFAGQADKTHAEYTKEIFADGLSTRVATNPKDMAFGMWGILERAGVANLPAPNYDDDAGNIYRTFTARISQFSSSLDLLFMAAVSGFSDQPSWVPDLSRLQDNEWNTDWYDLPSWLPGDTTHQITDEHGFHLFSTFGSRMRNAVLNRPNPAPISNHASLQLDITDQILTLRARRIGGIKLCFHFTILDSKIHNTPDLKRKVYLENLRLILKVAELTTEEEFATYLFSFVRFRRKSMWFPVNLVHTSKRSQRNKWNLSEEQRQASWVSFCRTRCHKDLTETFNLLLEDNSLRESQYSISELLSQQKRSLFLLDDPERIDVNSWGVCSRQVSPGDQVVRVDGVPQLLIFEKYAKGVGNAVKLVSPVLLLKPRVRPRTWFGKKREEVPWEEYKIY